MKPRLGYALVALATACGMVGLGYLLAAIVIDKIVRA